MSKLSDNLDLGQFKPNLVVTVVVALDLFSSTPGLISFDRLWCEPMLVV